jgi:uncharacterized protein YegL
MPIGVAEEEFVVNPEPRCACVICVDNSGSMGSLVTRVARALNPDAKGESPIDVLNEELPELVRALERDALAAQRVELSLVRFGGTVEVVQDFAPADQITTPILKAHGGTPMGAAINLIIDMAEERKRKYKDNGISYYRPRLFLITDGAPTDKWEEAAKRVHEGERDGKFLFFAVGVEGANMTRLAEIAPPNRPPMKLQGLKFAELFKWISDSLSQVSASSTQVGDEMIALPPTSGWAEGSD